jgi:hypothetical protein
MIIPRHLLIGARSATSGTRFCEVPQCTETTREGKPYCPEHVDHHPYVQQLLQDLAEQEDERERAAKKGAVDKVDLEGENAKAILRELQHHGERTLERLARDTKLPLEAVRTIGEALKRKNLVTFGQTKRKDETLKLATQAANATPPANNSEQKASA